MSLSPILHKAPAYDRHMLACFGMDENKVLILDMRSPGQPVAELVGHQAPLSGIAWGSGGNGSSTTGGGWIASCGMLCPQAFNQAKQRRRRQPAINVRPDRPTSHTRRNRPSNTKDKSFEIVYTLPSHHASYNKNTIARSLGK